MWFDAPLPRILAHRGLALHAVENTLPAFQAAVDAGVSYLESDIHATADGVAVLFHDNDLARDFGTPERIEQLTLAELREKTDKRAHIPTFAEALGAFPAARWNLDIKTNEAIAPTIEVIRTAEAEDRVLIASFGGTRSSRVAAAFPGVCRSPGVGTMAVVLLCAKLGAIRTGTRVLKGFDALQIPERMNGITVVSPRLVARYHAMGVEVHVWTVNNPADMRRLLAVGVDGLVTDRSDLALPVAEEFMALPSPRPDTTTDER